MKWVPPCIAAISGNRSSRPRLRRAPRRRGFTLAELSISVVSTSILLSGIASSIFIASKAVSKNNPASAAVSGSLITQEIAEELAAAKSITERTNHAITIKLADRDANGTDEKVRYSWNGVAGGVLTRDYNGATTVVAENVHFFQLAYSSQLAEAARTILFIRGNETGVRASYDAKRRDLLHSWGFQVIPRIFTATTLQSEIDTLLSKVDGVYISSTVNPLDIGERLNATTKGVVIEAPGLCSEFKIAAVDGSLLSGNQIKIDNMGHYITSVFGGGTISVMTSNQSLVYLTKLDTKAPGATKLCAPTNGPDWILPVVESGDELIGGSSSPGRRILLPWGIADLDPSVLSDHGKELLKRTLNWAASREADSAVEITLQIGSSSDTRIQTRVELVGRPTI